MTAEGKITAPQERAILALLSERTVDAAAIAAKVGNRTLHRWMKKDRLFIREYLAARARAVSQAIGRLQRASSRAVDALCSVMDDQEAPGAAKVAAARAVLEFAIKGAEVAELQRRVDELEAARETPDEPVEEVSIAA